MNYTKILIVLITPVFLLFACEDVIVLDLDDALPRVVIEATIDATNDVATVLVSKSNGFYEEAIPQYVSGADIQLSKVNGNTVTITDNDDGLYIYENLDANAGDEFNIAITVDGEVFNANSVVPSYVEIDTIEINFFTRPFGGGEEIAQLIPTWQDEPDVDNFYRFKYQLQDGEELSTFHVINDDLFAGEEMTDGIRYGFEVGDTVSIQFQTIEKAYFDYFQNLSAVVGNNGGDSNPFNPKGNFDNAALGYFGSYQEYKIELIIEK